MISVFHNRITTYNSDNLDVMRQMPAGSIDVICIDPPYLYLKGQKLERPFDEPAFFAECKRILTPKGFIVMFGRGTSFYRWNTILANLGFAFKEEVVWDKGSGSSPLMAISRVHETVSIFASTKDGGVINRVKVPYIEARSANVEAAIKDIDRLKSVLTNSKALGIVQDFLDGVKTYSGGRQSTGVTVGSHINHLDGRASVMQAMEQGMNERTIIHINRNYHKNTIHPTEKPVRLLERLLALVIPPDKAPQDIVVADFFAGSMSCMEAVTNMQMQGIAVEIDEEYYQLGVSRIQNLKAA